MARSSAREHFRDDRADYRPVLAGVRGFSHGTVRRLPQNPEMKLQPDGVHRPLHAHIRDNLRDLVSLNRWESQ